MIVSDLPVRAHLWYAGHGPRRVAFMLARIHPAVRSLSPAGDCWRLTTEEGSVYLSDPRQITRVVGIGVTMRGRVLRKYSMPGFVEVESGDTVVDVGAFIGEFSRPAGEIGEQVIAVEPDDRNAAALRQNLSHLPDSEVIERAAWHETGKQEFQTAGDPSEGSLLAVDTADVTQVTRLQTVRVADLVTDLGLGGVDYLKVEAEGAEPEALAGVGELTIPKVVVECAPERDGKTPETAVVEWLRDRGYAIRTRETIVFGRL